MPVKKTSRDGELHGFVLEKMFICTKKSLSNRNGWIYLKSVESRKPGLSPILKNQNGDRSVIVEISNKIRTEICPIPFSNSEVIGDLGKSSFI